MEPERQESAHCDPARPKRRQSSPRICDRADRAHRLAHTEAPMRATRMRRSRPAKWCMNEAASASHTWTCDTQPTHDTSCRVAVADISGVAQSQHVAIAAHRP